MKVNTFKFKSEAEKTAILFGQTHLAMATNFQIWFPETLMRELFSKNKKLYAVCRKDIKREDGITVVNGMAKFMGLEEPGNDNARRALFFKKISSPKIVNKYGLRLTPDFKNAIARVLDGAKNKSVKELKEELQDSLNKDSTKSNDLDVG